MARAHRPGNHRRRIVVDEHFAGMKSAVNVAGAMRGVETASNSADSRDQIVDRRRAEITERGFKGNATGFG